MTTINIHKDKLLPAAFAYQQRVIQEILEVQNVAIDKIMLRSWLFRPKTRLNAAKIAKVYGYTYYEVKGLIRAFAKEYVKLQTACRVAEDGIVSLDIDVVQRIFGEEE